MLFERVIASIIPMGGLGNEEAVQTFFESYMKQREKMKDVILMGLEQLAVHEGMRRKKES
jgi:hypothetical protein